MDIQLTRTNYLKDQEVINLIKDYIIHNKWKHCYKRSKVYAMKNRTWKYSFFIMSFNPILPNHIFFVITVNNLKWIVLYFKNSLHIWLVLFFLKKRTLNHTSIGLICFFKICLYIWTYFIFLIPALSSLIVFLKPVFCFLISKPLLTDSFVKYNKLVETWSHTWKL